jgi:hypothetical protein
MDEERDFLRLEEVADYLRMSHRMIRMIPADELPYFQQTGRTGRKGHRKYHRLDIVRYVERQTVRT